MNRDKIGMQTCYVHQHNFVIVYLTLPGPSNFGNKSLIFTQFQNKKYHWIPCVLLHLVIGLTKSN